jgi:hypothetical protein
MADRVERFLKGDRPDDVAFYLHQEGVGNIDALGEIGIQTDKGVVLVLPGDEGRSAFQRVTSLDPMDFAGIAMQNQGSVARDLTDGVCPAGTNHEHYAKFVFAFAEEHHPEMDGLYAEGDVIHGYAACACGETYAEKWVADGRTD